MCTDPSVFNAFFAIPKEQIAHDLAHAEENLDRTTDEIQALRRIPRNDRTTEIEAREIHLHLVRGYALRNRREFTEAERLYLAAFGAEDVVERALCIGREPDRLAEIHRNMAEIRKREGLSDDDGWYIGEGPEDYQLLVREHEAHYDRIHDTVFAVVLRRYGMNDVADFVEEDREGYTKLVEEGAVSFRPHRDNA